MPRPRSVLVLDASQRSALAAIRSLGRRGISLTSLSSGQSPIGGSSRFCLESVQSNPLRDPSFGSDLDHLRSAMMRLSPHAVFPTTDASTLLAYAAQEDGNVTLVAPPRQKYLDASDKARLVAAARAAGVRTPDTDLCSGREALRRRLEQGRFPCVVKPARSRFLGEDGSMISTSVSIIRDPLDASAVVERAGWVEQIPALVQEYVPGHGAGVFALYGPRGPVAWFAHRRLREKPPSGGVSVLSESVPLDPALQQEAQRLLDHLRWQGLAMVEFRIAPDGTPYLMEINARLWGSVQLAIDCGVDFPWLAYQVAIGEEVSPVTGYAVGRRLRWLLGDLDHLWLRWKDPATSLGQKLGASARFAGSFADLRARNEVFRWSDPAPAWTEFRNWLQGSP